MKYRILSDSDQYNVETWMNDLSKAGWVLKHFEVVYSHTSVSTRYVAVMEKNETKD